METKPEQPTGEPEVVLGVTPDGDVITDPDDQRERITDDSPEPEAKPAKKKAPVKRKKAAARSKRPRKATEPVELTPVPLNREEIVETLGKAKDEFIVAIGEPVMGIVGKYSQMARDGLSGLVSGFLGNKKRGR